MYFKCFHMELDSYTDLFFFFSFPTLSRNSDKYSGGALWGSLERFNQIFVEKFVPVVEEAEVVGSI